MKLSIIIPVYNVKSYLEKCLKSVLEIDGMNYEILLINDGSTDGSEKICEKFYKKYPEIIKYQTQKNSGLSATRNKGIKEATGDYICFIDSDDFIESDKLVKLFNIIQNKQPDITYFGYYFESETYKIEKYPYRSDKNKLFNINEFLKNELDNRNLPVAACFGIYKKSLITNNNLYFKTGILHEDERWTPELLLNAKKIYTSNKIIYHYIQRENSIMHKKDRTKNGLDLIETCNYLDKHANLIKDKDLQRKFKNRQAMVYMRATVVGKLYRKPYKNTLNRYFPINHAYKLKDKIKSFIYMLSPFMYFITTKIAKKGD